MSNEVENEIRQHPASLSIGFGAQWNVMLPRVYRYEDKEWIDKFFETGELRLSTFSKFSTYQDEQRGDTSEGLNILHGRGSNHEVFMVAGLGHSSLILCTSTKLDQQLATAFERDGAFEIMDTPAFAREISRQLPGFRHGAEGPCIYTDGKILRRKIDFDMEKFRAPDGNMDMAMLPHLQQQIGGLEQLFNKDQRYSQQAEYRLAWELDSLPANYIDIRAPLARQFCRPVSF